MAEYSDTEKIASLISASSDIMLVGHTNPDGDSVGSLIAMGCFLEDMGKKVLRVVPNELPRPLRNVKGKVKIYEFVSSEAYVRERARTCDLVVCMDFNDISSRIGALSEVVMGCGCPRVLIDHHLEPSLADFNAVISDTSASSTCYLVYKLITDIAGEEAITPRMASAVYLGMATDTGKFSYGALTPDLFRAVAVLVERGADIVAVDMAVFNSQSEGRMRLVGYALSEKMVVLFGHKSGDTEGLVNMPMQIEGIDTSALFMETGEGIKISLRSRGAEGLDVNAFARTYFTGGGHRNAAGAKSFVSMDETVARFIEGLRTEDEKRRGQV